MKTNEKLEKSTRQRNSYWTDSYIPFLLYDPKFVFSLVFSSMFSSNRSTNWMDLILICIILI